MQIGAEGFGRTALLELACELLGARLLVLELPAAVPASYSSAVPVSADSYEQRLAAFCEGQLRDQVRRAIRAAVLDNVCAVLLVNETQLGSTLPVSESSSYEITKYK